MFLANTLITATMTATATATATAYVDASSSASATKPSIPYITTITFPPTFTPTPQASTFPQSQGIYQCVKGDYHHRAIDTSTPPIPLTNFISSACEGITGGKDTILHPGEIRGASEEVTNFQIINHSNETYALSSTQCESLLDSLAFRCTVHDPPRDYTAGGCAYTTGGILQGCIFPYYGINFPGKE